MFWELNQQRHIYENKAQAKEASREARTATRSLMEIEDRLDRLVLINAALWELLRDLNGLDESKLEEKVAEIDIRDGQADGKISKQVKDCSACGRTLHLKHLRCLYCGEISNASIFDAVK